MEQAHIDVQKFIKENYTKYNGNPSFLEASTQRTLEIWETVKELMKKEQEKGILDLDTDNPSSILSHKPGYIHKEKEIIVGLQTDKPLKRAIKPNGGIRLVESAASSYGYEIPEHVRDIYYKYRKTHNDGVFSVYNPFQRLLRSKHIITGLPDNYGRGRIIGDYRRVALYGVDKLIESKMYELDNTDTSNDEKIRLKEEIFEQIKALEELKQLALSYGFDISNPAQNSREALQWMYFAYLGAVKQQDGAAMSFGRIDDFLDIYIEKDLKEGIITEKEAQEIIDDFVIKLRMVRHLRTPEYNKLFAGDPTWVTLAIGGISEEGEHMITKTSYRLLHTLKNLGPSPEPNLSVLWADKLPDSWKEFCSQVSIETSSIQYLNDDLMRKYFTDDYAIACCVSGMKIGKDMQFFGARCNLAKALLLAINGGKAEQNGESIENDLIIEGMEQMKGKLDYSTVWNEFVKVINIVAKEYVAMMNIIHYMHDKYNYESLEMALHDTDVHRYMAFGIAGLSIVADSLSAIKYATVEPIITKTGNLNGFDIKGEYPQFGNNDDKVDSIAVEVVKEFEKALKKHPTYKNAQHTLSVLTITSNIVYGEATGATPDGRKAGLPFAPGANPMHNRDQNGAIASLNSVAKLPYENCLDGISNTFSVVPSSLGKTKEERIGNLVQILNGYMVGKKGHHLNINVLDKEKLIDAQIHPERYPQLTIRVSGYAVLFTKLTKAQQDDVIARTIHSTI